VYLPYLQPPLTDKIIAQAEAKMGYKLPTEYIELLKIQNGGYIRFATEDLWQHSMISGIGPYLPSTTEFDWLKDYEGTVSYQLDGLFPFDGDGHWNICLDYRKNHSEPEVTYIDTELDYEKPIAKSFGEYIRLLCFDPDASSLYVLETDDSVEYNITRMASALEIKFGEPDHLAYGYPVYRGEYKGSFLFVSPNKVAHGFIRPNDSRYHELKHLMEPQALRYPEIPEKSLLLDTEQKEPIVRLNENGFKVSSLLSFLNNGTSFP
jgi:hypothetical protein